MDRPLLEQVGGSSVIMDVSGSPKSGLGEPLEVPGDVLGVRHFVTCHVGILTLVSASSSIFLWPAAPAKQAPGGPIISGSLPPFPEEGPGEGPGDDGDDDPDETTMRTIVSDGQSTTKIASEEQSTAASSTQYSASKAEYFLVASPSAAQGEIEAELNLFDPAKRGTYEPDVGNNSVSGGAWIDYQLDVNQSVITASRTDIILV